VIDATRLRQALSYDPATGQLVWRENRRGRFARIGAVAGYRKATGYLTVTIDGEAIYAHRAAWLLSVGPIPAGMEIDHLDHDPSNNRLDNLRLVNGRDNKANQRRSRRNTSGVTGVFWSANANAWCAQIKAHGVVHHLGYFKSLAKAASERKRAEAAHGFHPNHGSSNHAAHHA